MPDSRRGSPKDDETIVFAPALGFEPATFPGRFERKRDGQARHAGRPRAAGGRRARVDVPGSERLAVGWIAR
jgi:hypothetical protein